MQNEPIEVTLKVTAVFEKLGVPYFIGGSLASTLHGMVRTTQDADVVAKMRVEHLQPFISALQDEFYLDDQMIAESIKRSSSFNIIHRETFFKVDIFIPHPRPFWQSQLVRAQKQTFTFETEISMAEVGQAWQNGYAERVIRTIREDEIDLSDYVDFDDALAQIGDFIDDVYAHKRIHSALGYLAPAEFEAAWVQQQ